VQAPWLIVVALSVIFCVFSGISVFSVPSEKGKGPSSLSDDGPLNVCASAASHHPSRSGMPRTTPTIMTTPTKLLITM
jgi:hypothetical protein